MYNHFSIQFLLYYYSLSLLWFYTFGTQIFRNEDGYANDKIESVANLLEENRTKYNNSAIFLFFHGRLERMKVWHRLHYFVVVVITIPTFSTYIILKTLKNHFIFSG